jgi:hypothetical protein
LSAEAWTPDPSAYTVVAAVRVEGVPHWHQLADAASGTLARHDVLTWRLSIDAANNIAVTGGPDGAGLFAVEQVDLTSVPVADADATILSRLHEERQRRIPVFTPGARRRIRIILFHIGTSSEGDSGVCALIAHHLFIDEYSTDLIWNEMFQRAAGRSTADNYDVRYAAWARATAEDHAQDAARHAAGQVTRNLHDASLDFTTFARPGRTDPASPVRFEIPTPLTVAVATTARKLDVPVAAVYGAAMGHVLCVHAKVTSMTISVPTSRRTDIADIGTVGCYVNTIPVRARVAGEAGLAIHSWYRELTFASEHAHADASAIRAGLGGSPQTMLAFESRRAQRSVKPITWRPLLPPDGPAKAPLSCFLSPGVRHGPGDGRLVWRDGFLDRTAASELADAFLDAVVRLAGNSHLPPASEAR